MYFSWSNLIVGVIGMGLGVWVVKEAFYLNHHILFLGWVEQKWGPGTGTFAYKLIGIIIIVFCVFLAIGQINLFDSSYGASTTTQNSTNTPTIQSTSSTRSGIAP